MGGDVKLKLTGEVRVGEIVWDLLVFREYFKSWVFMRFF